MSADFVRVWLAALPPAAKTPERICRILKNQEKDEYGMRMLPEIVLPETKPETEWINGRAVQKVMPTTEHTIIQKAFLDVLSRWNADERGIVGAEWRFRVPTPDVDIHPLVPDVAFLSFGRFRSLPKADRQVPTLPPEIVVEVISPTDERADIEAKRKEYMAWNVALQIEANPAKRIVDFYAADGGHEQVDATCESHTPASFPDLHFPIRAMFAKLDAIFED